MELPWSCQHRGTRRRRLQRALEPLRQSCTGSAAGKTLLSSPWRPLGARSRSVGGGGRRQPAACAPSLPACARKGGGDAPRAPAPDRNRQRGAVPPASPPRRRVPHVRRVRATAHAAARTGQAPARPAAARAAARAAAVRTSAPGIGPAATAARRSDDATRCKRQPATKAAAARAPPVAPRVVTSSRARGCPVVCSPAAAARGARPTPPPPPRRSTQRPAATQSRRRRRRRRHTCTAASPPHGCHVAGPPSGPARGYGYGYGGWRLHEEVGGHVGQRDDALHAAAGSVRHDQPPAAKHGSNPQNQKHQGRMGSSELTRPVCPPPSLQSASSARPCTLAWLFNPSRSPSHNNNININIFNPPPHAPRRCPGRPPDAGDR
jgi:hypothetical protein